MKVAVATRKTINYLSKIPTIAWFAIILIIAGSTYYWTKEQMLAQDAWMYVIKTGATVNFAIALIIYSRFLDNIIKKFKIKTASFKGISFWLLGMGLAILVLRMSGNYTTVFDVGF